jgi:hypothetical protein
MTGRQLGVIPDRRLRLLRLLGTSIPLLLYTYYYFYYYTPPLLACLLTRRFACLLARCAAGCRLAVLLHCSVTAELLVSNRDCALLTAPPQQLPL